MKIPKVRSNGGVEGQVFGIGTVLGRLAELEGLDREAQSNSLCRLER